LLLTLGRRRKEDREAGKRKPGQKPAPRRRRGHILLPGLLALLRRLSRQDLLSQTSWDPYPIA
jgi:hypothetical protein